MRQSAHAQLIGVAAMDSEGERCPTGDTTVEGGEQVGSPFVWFDLRTPKGDAARRFYAGLLDWEIDGNGALTSGGAPWGAVAEDEQLDAAHWLPYVQVEDVDVAAAKARNLGAAIVQEKTAGPAGHFIVIADPLGAPVALWQPT